MSLVMRLFGLRFEKDAEGDEDLCRGDSYYGTACPHHEFGVYVIDSYRYYARTFEKARRALVLQYVTDIVAGWLARVFVRE